MSEITTGVRAPLSAPAVYELWSRLVGGKRARSTLVKEHVRPRGGARVLDLGCGPGELFPDLGAVEYVGIDISESYIARARKRFGSQASFVVGDATDLPAESQKFDLAIAFGVLHHVDDAGAEEIFRGVNETLLPQGRFVTVDPTFTPDQSRFARATISRDRGQHVRVPADYIALASSAFGCVKAVVRSDLLRIPYTHCVLECEHQLPPQS